jgi:peptidoglycan/LPS O-acetylase OafA/YrhL
VRSPGASGAYRDYIGRTRFGSLDGLRFLCIAAVLWHHAPWWTSMVEPPTITERGFVGVDFFFVLSGYLITTLLLRETRERGSFSLTGFYWRRALRILPVYFFVVTVIAIYMIGVKGRTEFLQILPYYYVFLSNFLVEHITLLQPTWSLAVEEQYYLVWPLVLALLPRKLILPVLTLAIAVNVLIIMGAFGGSAPELGPLRFALPNATYAPILIGSALALLLDKPAVFGALWPVLGRKAAAPVAFGLLLVLLETLPGDLRGLPNLALHLTMAVALACLVMREDHHLAPFLRWRPVARMGEISYGIYLYHLIGLHFATVGLTAAGVTSGPVVLVVYSAVSFVIADISDRTLERFFRGFRNRGPGAPRPTGTDRA